MAIVRETGAPNLFITMTYNPNWPEIKENLRPGEKASDRPDVVARVFMQKLKTLNKDLDEGLLGVVDARIHVAEYQKRGLPHAHILLIMRPGDKPVTAEDVDRLTSAKLPNNETHPELYETVISNMLHGPCGQQNPKCPCMKNGNSSKKFPKQFAEETIMVEDKYPTYRRRRPEGILSHKGKVLDNAKINQWVVPYNPFLSQKYDSHINVEVCATNKAVKYIYKYVYKGSDMTTITIEGEEIQANEILQYLLGRYISPLADYLVLNGKTLSMYDLPDLETYSDVSDEVARQSADPMNIVAQEVAAYEPDDLERTATLADQMNENQKDIFDQVIEAVNHPSQKAELISKASLIIWDEALMMHRTCFEAVDRSFRDIMKNELEPFGGKVMVFSGDHRQILPVLKDATRAETLEACFKRKRNVNALIDAVYPGVGDDNLPDEYFVERAILAPTNASVRRINDTVSERLSGETKEYLSVDSLEGVADPNMFEPEFLNSLNFSGIPPHRIVLKVGTPIIMIRKASIHSIRIIFYNEDDDKEFPFNLRRKQFPVVPAFAMTINKAQGQSIHHVGIYLEFPVFAHGQLYVALSRVTSRKAIKIAVDPEAIDEDENIHPKNIVYREIFDF
ncbi:Helitron helicase-like protein [Phytophthora palmivora]|uniref:ATP-dependent DNA helicase n=1 Tax=Phytophthora palmivora TaxID=4796 RepID=A0A2P4XVC6_9STRA|nr:Helitron helicase-like protein [Phytophthora palmivora]